MLRFFSKSSESVQHFLNYYKWVVDYKYKFVSLILRRCGKNYFGRLARGTFQALGFALQANVKSFKKGNK
jgi:hypothetical protein